MKRKRDTNNHDESLGHKKRIPDDMKHMESQLPVWGDKWLTSSPPTFGLEEGEIRPDGTYVPYSPGSETDITSFNNSSIQSTPLSGISDILSTLSQSPSPSTWYQLGSLPPSVTPTASDLPTTDNTSVPALGLDVAHVFSTNEGQHETGEGQGFMETLLLKESGGMSSFEYSDSSSYASSQASSHYNGSGELYGTLGAGDHSSIIGTEDDPNGVSSQEMALLGLVSGAYMGSGSLEFDTNRNPLNMDELYPGSFFPEPAIGSLPYDSLNPPPWGLHLPNYNISENSTSPYDAVTSPYDDSAQPVVQENNLSSGAGNASAGQNYDYPSYGRVALGSTSTTQQSQISHFPPYDMHQPMQPQQMENCLPPLYFAQNRELPGTYDYGINDHLALESEHVYFFNHDDYQQQENNMANRFLDQVAGSSQTCSSPSSHASYPSDTRSYFFGYSPPHSTIDVRSFYSGQAGNIPSASEASQESPCDPLSPYTPQCI